MLENIKHYEEIVFASFKLAALTLTLTSVLLIKIWGITKIWHLIRQKDKTAGQ